VSIYALMTNLVTVKRVTRNVLDAVAVASSHNPDRQPAATGVLAVLLASMSDAVGTVTIAGTVDGSSDSETITTTANRRYTTVKRFSAVDASGGVMTSGLAGGTVQVQAESEATYDLTTGYPAAKQTTSRGQWPDRLLGTHQDDRATWLLAYSEVFTPRVGDRIAEEMGAGASDTWEVKQITPQPDQWRPTHWECQCVRRATP